MVELISSGYYERFFEVDGRRYSYFANPKTGWPESFWRSVTVPAPLAATAVSCSTIAMLHEAEGLRYLERSGFSYPAIDLTGRINYNNL